MVARLYVGHSYTLITEQLVVTKKDNGHDEKWHSQTKSDNKWSALPSILPINRCTPAPVQETITDPLEIL